MYKLLVNFLFSSEMEFVQGSTVPFEEDKDYEFKMHLDLCEDDLPAWLQTGACCGKRTRRAISKFAIFLSVLLYCYGVQI